MLELLPEMLGNAKLGKCWFQAYTAPDVCEISHAVDGEQRMYRNNLCLWISEREVFLTEGPQYRLASFVGLTEPKPGWPLHPLKLPVPEATIIKYFSSS